MDSSLRTGLRRSLLLLDGITILLAMILAMGIHSYLRQHIDGLKAPPELKSYLLLASLTLPLWLTIARALGLHRQLEQPFDLGTLVAGLLRLHLYGLLGLTLLIYLTQVYMNRTVVMLFLMLTLLLMLASRLLTHWAIRLEHMHGHAGRRILLLADSVESVREISIAGQVQPNPPTIVGCLGLGTLYEHGSVEGLPVFGPVSQLQVVLRENAVDEVLLSCGVETRPDLSSVLRCTEEVGIPLRLLLRTSSLSARPPRIDDGLGLPSLVFDAGRPAPDSLIVKRVMDVVVSTMAIVALSPLMLAVAMAVLAVMGRPVLIKQKRTGRNGRVFEMYKFRTMVKNAEQLRQTLAPHNELDGPAFKMATDPRVTRLGRFLRRSSLDELPQLWNVLAGSMSLVGPRPLIVSEQECISGPQRRRLSMKPGMTGLWQISGRSDVDFKEWMQLDLHYVDTWSLHLDVQLLLRTIPAVLTGRGAR